MYSGNSLPTFRDKILILSSIVKESKKKKYLKMQTNTVLRVRQFQPSHALLMTELCDENLRIFRLNAACLFFTYPLTCRVCIVISV
jgi:hypothetical protein